MIDRRMFLAMLVLGLAGPVAVPAFAKDDGGGSDGGGSDGGGSDGGGSDDGGGDSGGGSDDSGSDDSGGKTGSNSGDGDDDDRIRTAVKKGEAASLRNILSVVRERYRGDIIHIRLTGKGSSLQYRIRMISSESKLLEIRVNAKTAKILGVTGL